MTSLLKFAMPWLALPLILSTCLATGIAQAHDRGDRFEHRLDVRGDRIDHRMDLRAERQLALGHPRRAMRLDRWGDRIDRRLDRMGDRHHRHFRCH